MNEFSVLSWNVQGQRYRGTGLAFSKILPTLSSASADIICLQEMPDASGKLSDIKKLKDYHVYIPPLNSSGDMDNLGFNHNVLLSKFPITNAVSFAFPCSVKEPLRLENAIKADIEVGNRQVRFYICHFTIGRAGMASRLRQIEFILADAANYKGAIVICGDMNAALTKNSLVRKIFKWWHHWPAEEMYIQDAPRELTEKELFHQKISLHGFRESLDLNRPTWSPFRNGFWELFKLKLDWFLVKNLQPMQAVLGDYVSDHRSVHVICKFDD